MSLSHIFSRNNVPLWMLFLLFNIHNTFIRELFNDPNNFQLLPHDLSINKFVSSVL